MEEEDGMLSQRLRSRFSLQMTLVPSFPSAPMVAHNLLEL